MQIILFLSVHADLHPLSDLKTSRQYDSFTVLDIFFLYRAINLPLTTDPIYLRAAI